MSSEGDSASSLRRALGLLKVLGGGEAQGKRISDLASETGLSPPTIHRLLKDLVAEGFVEQIEASRRYRVALGLFVLAARAGIAGQLRDLARPALLRISATLTDTVFLLVRDRFDAVCIDRIEGPFPIRSFTGDIGGRVPLGLGQGSLVILAHLPEDEREAVIRFNVPRLIDRGYLDEATMRAALDVARAQGWVNLNTGLIPGMAGLGVPIFDAAGSVVGALSIGTLAERLGPERLPGIVKVLQAEAQSLGVLINPFDLSLRYPARAFAGASGKS